MDVRSRTLDPITARSSSRDSSMRAKRWDRGAQRGVFANIKERLDHSCAIFDAKLRLVAQAEHIPCISARCPGFAAHARAYRDTRGDAAGSGSSTIRISRHALNDVTVIGDLRRRRDLRLCVQQSASPDVGGMVRARSASARELFAEGFIMPPMRLMRDDASCRIRSRCFARTRARRKRAAAICARSSPQRHGRTPGARTVDRYGAPRSDA